MDKVAFYVEEIEKIASRAWKAHIGELSEAAVRKLKDLKILNHKKELAGLNKGTENIVKHHGGTIGNFNANRVGKLYSQEIKHNKLIKGMIADGTMSKEDMLNGLKSQHKATHGFMSISGNHTKAVVKGKLKKGNALDTMMGGLPKGRTNKQYAEAIMNRHEADELRFGQSALKGRKNNIIMNGEKTPAGQYQSHITTKVLGAESANTAIAPKDVRKKMMELRDTTGETPALKTVGLDYGKSGVYDKPLNQKINAMQVKPNKRIYKDMYGAK